MHPVLQMLEGGDRRSIGRSNEVVAEVMADPGLFRVVFSGLTAADPLVRMRSADAVEKITAQRPEFLRPYKHRLIREIAATDQKEIRWHVAQMLPRLCLDDRERKRVLQILLSYLSDRSSIVRTFTMQALVDIVRDAPELQPAIRQRIVELTAAGTPAMQARGRKLLKEFGRPTTTTDGARRTRPPQSRRARRG